MKKTDFISGAGLAQLRAAVDSRFKMGVEILDELRRRSADGDGVTRASYGEGEQIGHDLMRVAAANIGLEVTGDTAGNLYATLPGADRSAPRWISGSHLDSVPCGGNFDGAAGAVAALVALAALKDLGIHPAMDVSAMAIRAEEASSWFSGRHHSHFGSRAALGLLKFEELEAAIHVGTGQTLAQSMNAAGLDAEALRRGPPALSCSNVCGFIELHIEQGPVLVAQDAAVGIVSAIRGTIRARNARCVGAYSHSGAVPQELRRDAVLAAVEFINTIERHCADLRKAGTDIVFAVGRLHTDAKADSLSKVPGLVSFTIDLRSQDPTVLTALDLFLDELASKVGGRRNVAFDISDRTLAAPAVMDTGFRATLKDMAKRIGLRAPEVPCGAGHDAAEFVRAGIPSCMIFVRNSGESHNPDESMDAGDFRDGLLLLTSFLTQVVGCRTAR